MKINSKTIKYSLTLAFLTIAGFYVYHSFAGVFKINRSKANDLTSGLVGYWTFDGADTTSTTVADKSSSARNGTLSGATKPNPIIGKIGQGMNFNGSTSYINVAGFTQWYQLPLSYGAWIKLNATPAGDRYAIYKSGEFYLRIGATSVGCKEDNSGQAETVKTVTLVPGQWYHIFCSLSSGSKKIYINGADSSATVGGFGPSPYGETLKIGGEPDYYGIFNGQMDEVRIYNVALSDSEITELYQQGQTKINSSQTNKLTSGLVVYYTMDGQDTTWTDASSGTVADKSSGGTNTGTLYGMSQSTSPAVGKIGQAFSFVPASGTVIEKASASGLPQGNSAFSVSAWFNYSTLAAGNYVTAWGLIGSNKVNWLGVNRVSGTTGKVCHAFYGNDLCGNTVTLSKNTWYHVVVTYNSTTRKIYLNGVQDASANPSSVPAVSGSVLDIGMNTDYDWPFTGKIDEVRIYGRELSQSEVTELYQQGQMKINSSQSGKLTNGLVGYWTMDGQDIDWGANTINNKVAGGANLTAANMDTTNAAIGKVGQALSFDGSAENLTATDAASPELDFSTPGITMSAWIKLASDFSGSGTILSNVTSNPDAGFRMNLDFDGNCGNAAGGDTNFCIRYGTVRWMNGDNDVELYKNRWYHIVATHDGVSSLKYYVDGQLINSSTYAVTTTNPNTANFVVGGFKGLADEIRIYDRELSQSEVTELYNMGR